MIIMKITLVQKSKVSTSATKKSVDGEHNIVKLKYGSQLYLSPYNDSSLVFEESGFDFDLLESALNLYSAVQNKNIFTRSLQGKDQKELLKVINSAISGLPIKKIDVMNKVLSKTCAKHYTKYVSDLQAAYNAVDKSIQKAE
jgi:hypothetical protein